MPRILIIEDNQESREALARRLQRRGYDIVEAVDGQQGVKLAKSEKPDLVLMDMNMPILDGWQASQLIRAAPETEELPIIGMTAHALAGDREKALEAGCSEYLTKPVDFPQLLAQVESLIRAGGSSRPPGDRPEKPATSKTPES
jgi:two-component system cell cycle response regulator DivK